VPTNPSNPFGDETVRPLGSKFDESSPIAGIPKNPPSEPPLPIVPGDFPANIPIRPAPRPETWSEQEPIGHHRKKPPLNWGRLLLWLTIIVASIPVIYFMIKARRDLVRETHELSFTPAKARMTLAVNQEWQELGFVLRPGDHIVIKASGEYFNEPHGILTAEGLLIAKDQKQESRSVDPLFPHGCLIARTRGKPTEIFHIGAGGVLKTDTGGRLQVQVNDLDLIANRGSLKIVAETYLDQPPGGEKLRGVRDSAVTPIYR
jgi:hypothetical protein